MTKKNNDVNERDVLGKLQHWIKSNNQTTYDLIGALDVFAMPSAELENQTAISIKMVQHIGLDSIVSLYCQKGNQFKFAPFAENMGAMSVNYFVSLKIHTVLEKWHELADAPPMKENSPALINSSPEDEHVSSDDNFVII